jgi:hypothetical protein
VGLKAWIRERAWRSHLAGEHPRELARYVLVIKESLNGQVAHALLAPALLVVSSDAPFQLRAAAAKP